MARNPAYRRRLIGEVQMSKEARLLSDTIARHQRLDPMTEVDRCTCGEPTPLGRSFYDHVAQALLTAGWTNK